MGEIVHLSGKQNSSMINLLSLMAQQNDSSKIIASVLIGVFTVIVGSVMLNTAAGIIGGIVMFVFLLCHDD